MLPLTNPILLSVILTTAYSAPLTTPSFLRRADNSSCAPGGNFDLSIWSLQLPTGSDGKIDQISYTKLQNCDGYSDSAYFSTANDGAISLKVPPRSTCFTTTNSKHCRTELREVGKKGKTRSWDPKNETNRLKVKLAVPLPDDSKYGTVIGQIHVDDAVSSKPVCELFYNKNGNLTIGVEQVPDESSLEMTDLGVNVPKGKTFTYEIRYEKGNLSVSINGGPFKTLGTGSLDSPLSYFKVGNYNQGNDKSEVSLYSIDVDHS